MCASAASYTGPLSLGLGHPQLTSNDLLLRFLMISAKALLPNKAFLIHGNQQLGLGHSFLETILLYHPRPLPHPYAAFPICRGCFCCSRLATEVTTQFPDVFFWFLQEITIDSIHFSISDANFFSMFYCIFPVSFFVVVIVDAFSSVLSLEHRNSNPRSMIINRGGA